MAQRVFNDSLADDLATYRARAGRRSLLTTVAMVVLGLIAVSLILGVLALVARFLGLCTEVLGDHLHGNFQRIVDDGPTVAAALRMFLP